MSAHVASLKSYVAVFLALMVLTAVTVGAAFFDLGPLNTVIMIAIAGTKATLVVLYFMHLRYATRLIPVVVLSGVFWLGILFALMFADYFTRDWLGVEGR
jgi:cytochrome c oxidase subunit 4